MCEKEYKRKEEVVYSLFFFDIMNIALK